MKIQPGDLVRIPTFSSEEYGLVQILKREHPKRNGSAFMALFDGIFTLDKIKSLTQEDLESLTILSYMPLDLFNITSRGTRKRWFIVKHLDIIDIDLPMFQLYSPAVTGKENAAEATVILDFGFNYYRLIEPHELAQNRNYFTRSSEYFEDIVNQKYFQSNLFENYPPGFVYTWQEGIITEKDMVINEDKYQKWMGCGSSWKEN